jgi:hypothetical protein
VADDGTQGPENVAVVDETKSCLLCLTVIHMSLLTHLAVFLTTSSKLSSTHASAVVPKYSHFVIQGGAQLTVHDLSVVQ